MIDLSDPSRAIDGERTIVYWTGTQQPLCSAWLVEGPFVRLPAPNGAPWISIVLGGGYTKVADGEDVTEIFYPNWLIGNVDSVDGIWGEGSPYIEQVTGRLAGDKRVFIGYPSKTREAENNWRQMMKAAGFRVRPARDIRFNWCAIGSGTQLARTPWLKGAWSGWLLVFATADGPTPLEARWRLATSDASDELLPIWREMDRDPSSVWRFLAGADLFLSRGGYENDETILNVSGISVERIHETLNQTASELGYRLYYGGEATQASEERQGDNVFAPEQYGFWSPLPVGWKRIV